MDLKDNVLVSGLIFQEKVLSPNEIMQALIDGKKIKLRKVESGINFYLKDGQIKSDTISYLKGIPQTWFNPDIKYVIDYD